MFFWVVGFSDFCSLISGGLVWGWNNKFDQNDVNQQLRSHFLCSVQLVASR